MHASYQPERQQNEAGASGYTERMAGLLCTWSDGCMIIDICVFVCVRRPLPIPNPSNGQQQRENQTITLPKDRCHYFFYLFEALPVLRLRPCEHLIPDTNEKLEINPVGFDTIENSAVAIDDTTSTDNSSGFNSYLSYWISCAKHINSFSSYFIPMPLSFCNPSTQAETPYFSPVCADRITFIWCTDTVTKAHRTHTAKAHNKHANYLSVCVSVFLWFFFFSI